MEKKQIISLYTNLITYQEALDKVIDFSSKHTPSYVCFANGHMCIEAYWNKSFASYVNNASLVLTDGHPLTIALKLLYRKHQERIAGMDFLPSIIEASEQQGLSIFLFGSTPEVLKQLTRAIEAKHPHLKIVGITSPPFRAFTPEEGQVFVNQINESGAHIVLVGMGCPKQETWMAEYSKHINATLLGVGGAFSVYAGLTRRAPGWMQRFALEWFYRLIQEPKRMWKRYLVTNTLFVWLVFKQILFTRVGLRKSENQ